jgi:hypothetical protein
MVWTETSTKKINRAHKHEKCSISLVIKVMQNQTITRCYFLTVEWIKLIKSLIPMVDEDWEKLPLAK